jgi:uncharacterized protein (TIGR03437 family)
MAVWEVVSSDPQAIEDLSFTVAVVATTGTPQYGTITATGSLGPTEATAFSPTDYGPTEGASALPRFALGKPLARPAVSIAPVLQIPRLVVVSAASYAGTVAPDSIVAGFGPSLAVSQMVATTDPPVALGDTKLEVIDFLGVRRPARLFVVTRNQVNFLLDPETSPGIATATVYSGSRPIASGSLQVEPVAPALFSANGDGKGAVAGEAVRVRGSVSSNEPLVRLSLENGRWTTAPIDLGSEGDLVFLTLYGTGFRGRKLNSSLDGTIGGVRVPVLYAGPQGSYRGLDQVNLGPLPRSLAGRGELEILVQAEGVASNRVTIEVR